VAEKIAVAVPEEDATDPLGAGPAPESEISSRIFSGEEIMAALTLCDPDQPIPHQPLEHYLEREPEPIPKEALYGRIAEWARALDMPMSAAYPAMLAAYSAVPRFNKILGVPINLYVALLMPVGFGKNEVLRRACALLEMIPGDDYKNVSIGGAGGLRAVLGSHKEGYGKNATTVAGPKKLLVSPNEFGATLVNTKIENSTLPQHLCDLWDSTKLSIPTRDGKGEVDCRTSILGPLPVSKGEPEQFRKYFSDAAAAGLYSRFIFAPCDVRTDMRWAEEWAAPPSIFSEELGVPSGPECNPPTRWEAEARAFVGTEQNGIRIPDDVEGRGLYNMKRIALLTAMANGDKTVTHDCVQAAWYVMLWQAQVKRHFRIGIAEKSSGGELSAVIMDEFRKIDAKGSYERSPIIEGKLNINVARVIHNRNWAYRFGAEVVTRTVSALMKAGQLGEGHRLNQKGSVVPSKFHVTVTKFAK
jgi:hypothetical protein